LKPSTSGGKEGTKSMRRKKLSESDKRGTRKEQLKKPYLDKKDEKKFACGWRLKRRS